MSTDLKEALEAPRLMTTEERAAISKRLAEAATDTPFSPEDWVLSESDKHALATGKATPAIKDKAARNELLCQMLTAVGSVPDSEL